MLATVLVLAVLLLSMATDAADSPKQAYINKLKTLITGFFTDAQLSSLSDGVATDISSMKGGQVTAENMYRGILALKDAARVKKFKAAWAKVIKDIGGQAAAEKTYAKLKAFCTGSMWPMIKQIQDAVKQLKASGKKQPTPKDLVYSTLTKAMTQKNFADLLAATKKSLTAKEWTAISKDMNKNGLRFAKYGY